MGQIRSLRGRLSTSSRSRGTVVGSDLLTSFGGLVAVGREDPGDEMGAQRRTACLPGCASLVAPEEMRWSRFGFRSRAHAKSRESSDERPKRREERERRSGGGR